MKTQGKVDVGIKEEPRYTIAIDGLTAESLDELFDFFDSSPSIKEAMAENDVLSGLYSAMLNKLEEIDLREEETKNDTEGSKISSTNEVDWKEPIAHLQRALQAAERF